MAKRCINLGYGKDRDAGLNIEILCYDQVIPTQDRIEALKAFQEKRPPNFTGK